MLKIKYKEYLDNGLMEKLAAIVLGLKDHQV